MKPYSKERAIRGAKWCIAAATVAIFSCVGAAILGRTFLPLGGVLPNVIAILTGRFVIRHIRRQPWP